MRHRRQAPRAERETSPLRPLYLPVYGPTLVYSIGSGALQPVLVLAALSIGFSSASSSAVVGMFGLVGVVAAPPLGRLITRFGDRAALITGGIISFASLLLSILALVVGHDHPGFAKNSYVVSLVILGVASVVWSLARQAYVSELLTPLWRARGLSTLGGMTRVGQLIGPGIATLFISVWWIGSAFIFGLVMAALSTLMVIVFAAPDIASTEDNAPAKHERDRTTTSTTTATAQDIKPAHEKTIQSMFATVIMGIGINCLTILRVNRTVIVPLWGAYLGIDESIITATFAVSALVDTLMFVVAGGLMDKYGRLAALLPSLTVMPAGILIMALWQTLPGFVTGAAILGFGNGFGAGVVMTTGADLSPAHNRANFLGIWQAINNAGTAAGPFIASGMTHALGVEASLWSTAAIGLAGAVWFTALIKPAYQRLGIDLRGRPVAQTAATQITEGRAP